MVRTLSLVLRRIARALTRNTAATRPGHEDPGLRGRTYGIPFDAVWNETLAIVRSQGRWEVVEEDDLEGVIRIEATSRVFKFVDDMKIRIGLDPDAQTRVDAWSASRVGRADLGANARRIRGFFRELDRELGSARLGGTTRFTSSTNF